ncbi:coiled-coil domain-containing protein 180-like [Eucyclogobius newberryi]|uniref:coiled-coil domain-containing protein 180-like n=1 Tax=Eucyclogobius newberryi TaxID=166745 RepID=UPI003B596BD9
MAKSEPRAVASGKVYRQLFDAQVQLSRSLLATWKDQCVQNNTQCSTATSEKELVDTDDCEDVSGLPDTLVTSGSSSDVIDRMSKKKAAKHQETLLQLDTELTAISKVFESHVRKDSEELLTSLREVDLRLEKLSHRMERPEELTSHSLQDMCSLWEEVEEKMKLKKKLIIQFYCNLCQTETQRTHQVRAQIKTVLKNHGGLLEKISFLQLSDIQRLLHSKATMLNQSLLANRRSLCQLRLCLLVENLQDTSIVHQCWEDCMEHWKNSRVQQIVQHFSELCSKDLDEDLLSEQSEIFKIHQSLREVSVSRCEAVSSLSSLAPPTCTAVLVSDWFDQLKSFNHKIDGLHADLGRYIRNCYHQIWQERLEEVHRCENTLRDLQLSEAQVTNVVQSHFLPLIGQSQSKADERWAAFDVSCNSVSHHSLSLSSSVFGIMHRASFLWEEHCSNLQNIETNVQEHVKELRHLQKEQLERKRQNLDELLSILRQASNEENLNISLTKALFELQELHDSCRQHLLDQNTMLDRLPALYQLELQNYSSRLSAFFHLSSIYTPSPDEFGPVFSDLLDSSLKATLTIDKENSGENTDAAQYQGDSGLLDLYNMNSSEELSSSRGRTYKGPSFMCQSLELKEPLGNRLLEVFSAVLLSQTLSRVRSMFVEHMEQHFHGSVFSALSLLSHLKQEALIEQDVKLQQLNAQHVDQLIFQPRLAELQLHLKQVDSHCETVSHTLASLNTDLKDFLESVGKRNQTFSTAVSNCESSLESVDTLQRLETLSSILKDYLKNHIADTQDFQANFRKNMLFELEQLKQATTQLLCSFRLFSEGGNFTPYEMRKFQKKLKKEMKRINVAEESIHDQLEACHSNSLQQVRDVYSLQEKITSLMSEFMFVEKIQHVLRSTQVKIKTVAATCNQQQSDTSSKIHQLQILLEDREAQVFKVQVFSTLSILSQMLHQQAQCLHFTLVSQQRPLQEDTHLLAHLSSPSSALQPFYSGGGLHDDPLLGLIKSLNRDKTPAPPETEPRGGKGKGHVSSAPLFSI